MHTSEKKTMLAMICITMTYEIICSTARSTCVVVVVVYIPHTLLQYLLLIDRVTHQVYIDAVAHARGAGVGPPADPDPAPLPCHPGARAFFFILAGVHFFPKKQVTGGHSCLDSQRIKSV